MIPSGQLYIYVFMIIVWTVDTKHSVMFYPEFREWSIYLDHDVKHKTFYRIAECLVKIHSVLLMLVLIMSPCIVCCVRNTNKSNQSPLAESITSSRL